MAGKRGNECLKKINRKQYAERNVYEMLNRSNEASNFVRVYNIR